MQLGREAGKTEARSEKREVGSKKQESARNKKQKIRQQPPFDPGWMFKRINLQIAGRFVHRPVTKAALKLPMT